MSNTSIPTPYVTSIQDQAAGLSAAAGSLSTGLQSLPTISTIPSLGSITTSGIGGINALGQSLPIALPNVGSLPNASSLTNALGNLSGSALGASISPSGATDATLGIGSTASATGSATAAGTNTAALASTTFSTGVNNKLATVDVYTANTAATPVDITAPPPKINPLVALGMVSSALGLANNLVGDYKKLSSLKIDPKAIVTGLLSSSGAIAAAYNSLPIALQNAITIASFVNNASGGGPSRSAPNNSVYVANNGVSTNIKTATLNDVNALVAMTAAMTNGGYAPTVTDNSAVPIVLGNLISIAAALHLPGVYTAIANSISPIGPNARIKGTLAVTASTAAVSSGSLTVLSEVAHNGGSTAQANYPNLLTDFSKNYRLAPNETVVNYPIVGAQITSSYAAVNPNYLSVTSQAGNVNTLNAFKQTSADLDAVIAFAGAVAHTPPFVQPTSVITVPAAQVPTYVPPTGTGVTNTSVTNPDGSSTITVVYPPQQTPAPQPNSSGISAVGPVIPGVYVNDTIPIVSTTVSTTGSTNKIVSVFHIEGSGPTVTETTYEDGTVVTDKTDENGITTTTSFNPNVIHLISDEELMAPGDPLASTAYTTVSNPLVTAAAVNNICSKDAEAAAQNGTIALTSLNASDAINTSFPFSNLNNLDSLDLG